MKNVEKSETLVPGVVQSLFAQSVSVLCDAQTRKNQRVRLESPLGWNMGFGVTAREGSSPRLRELVIRMCVCDRRTYFRVYMAAQVAADKEERERND